MTKKLISTFIIIICSFIFINPANISATMITTYVNTPGAYKSVDFTAKADGTSLFVESFQAIDYVRFAAGKGSFYFEITASENIDNYIISPTTDNVTTGTVNGNKLTITIPSVPFHAVVKINNLKQICIFADPPESNPPRLADSNVVNAMDFVTDNTGATDQHDNIVNAINYVCKTAGKDTLYFPDGTYLTAPIRIDNRNNLKIYLKDGSLIKRKTADPCSNCSTFYFNGCTSCKLFGRGVVDSQGLEQYELNNVRGGSVQSYQSISIINCDRMRIEDIVNRNSNVWQFVSNGVGNSTYYNIKNICTKSGVPYSTDGFSIHNCHDITADHIFAMSNDDALIISSDNLAVPCENITVTNFTGYACRACAVVMGCNPYPGNYVKNVTVKDSDFRLGRENYSEAYLYPIKIETGPLYYENIRFINVGFNNNDANRDYITTNRWPDAVPSYIYVKGDLEFTNCSFENKTVAHLYGNSNYKINNLIVRNLKLGGRTMTSLSDANMTVSNISSIDFTLLDYGYSSISNVSSSVTSIATSSEPSDAISSEESNEASIEASTDTSIETSIATSGEASNMSAGEISDISSVDTTNTSYDGISGVSYDGMSSTAGNHDNSKNKNNVIIIIVILFLSISALAITVRKIKILNSQKK